LSEGGDRRDLQTNQAEKSPISQGKFLFKIISNNDNNNYKGTFKNKNTCLRGWKVILNVREVDIVVHP